MSNRIKYFSAHLSTSMLVAVFCLSMVFFMWYPSPLAKAVGVTQIFLMLVIIDVIVGPLLSLLVYKDSKKTLKMDLSIIILIQVVALGYGIYSIAQARPVWIVFNHDQFELVRNNEIRTEHIAQAQPQYQQPTWLQAQYVAVKQADDPQKQQIEQMGAMLNGVSLAQYPERYTPIEQVKEQMKNKALSLSQLNQWNENTIVQQQLKAYPKANAWLPLETYGLPMVVLINKEESEVVKVVDLRPWK